MEKGDKWETDGYWWISSDPTKQVPGRISYNPPSAITLALNGSFSELGATTTTHSHIPLINGLTRDGKFISLPNCVCMGSTLRTPGYFSENYQPLCILIGINAATQEEILFDRAFFDIDFLWNWISPEFFTEKFSLDDAGRLKAYILTVQPPSFDNYEQSGYSISYYTSYSMNSSPPNDRSFHASVSIGVHFSAARKPVDILNTFGEALRSLVTLGVGKQASLRKIHFQSPAFKSLINGIPGDQDVLVECLLPNISGKTIVDPVSLHPNFLFSDIQGQAADFFARWFERREAISPSFSLFFSVIGDRQMLITHAFTSLVHCLEVFHRRALQQVDREAHDQRMAGIKEKVTSEQWKWLSGRLGYSYEPGLRKRLLDIYERLPLVVRSTLGDSDQFASVILNTRNYLTHYSKDLENSYKPNEIPVYIAKLRIIMTTLFLQDLGFNEAQLDRIIKRNASYLNIPQLVHFT